MTRTKYKPDPRLDLVLERIVDVPRELVWKAWTTPEYLMKWFTPVPWMTVECEIDLRPGGVFRTVMRSPEGVDHPNTGCYLEVVENEKLVWTDALEQGYRPSESAERLYRQLLHRDNYTGVARRRDEVYGYRASPQRGKPQGPRGKRISRRMGYSPRSAGRFCKDFVRSHD